VNEIKEKVMPDNPVPPLSGSPDYRYDANKDQVEIVWKCLRCGQLLEKVSKLPDVCPSCGAPKTEFVLLDED
jgi:rubrerythrin